jgi:lysyl oxidase
MRRALRALVAAVVVAAAVSAGSPIALPAPAAAATDKLPDLRMDFLDEFRIQYTASGRRLLRFTVIMTNFGAGPFELRGSRASTSQEMTVRQIIYNTSGGSRSVPSAARMHYAGDGHNHWHTMEMTRYDLWGTAGTLHDEKIGLCFLDSDPMDLSIPGAAKASYYRGSWCGTSPSVLSNRMGLSVGWGDKYGWNLAWQWIDVTGMPGGTYYVRAMADPEGFAVESNDTNQCAYARITFGGGGTGVTVLGRGLTCPNDITGSPFEQEIWWAYDHGITTGCAPLLYCTNSSVTRGQMASFLARAMHLPATANDFFTDDETSIYEADINRTAEAGIFTGCGSGRACPEGLVSRAEMAAFLARALDLPATGTDFFTDDEGSIHEADINRLAAAGITTGCGGTSYCPTAVVRRGEMAALLYRSFS